MEVDGESETDVVGAEAVGLGAVDGESVTDVVGGLGAVDGESETDVVGVGAGGRVGASQHFL